MKDEYVYNAKAQNAKDVDKVAFTEPFLSLIIPAFNEEARINSTLDKWVSFLKVHQLSYEIIIIIDGCTDQTTKIASAYAKSNPNIYPFTFSKKLGKGGALIESFKRCQGQIYFFIDADGSLPPQDLEKFLNAINLNDLVIGCRYYKDSKFLTNLPFRRIVFSRAFNALATLCFNINGIKDTQCGAKAIRRSAINEIAGELFVTDFAFDLNLVYCAMHKGLKVQEVYVQYDHVNTDSKVSSKLFAVSLQMMLSLIRLRLYNSRFGTFLYNKRVDCLLQTLRRTLTTYL